MDISQKIKEYISAQSASKQLELKELHNQIQKLMPESKLWFLDGKDKNGKIVSNPNIGYGQQIIKYADGKSREFYQIGLSTNTNGISLYIIGISDKNILKEKFGNKIGKATISGYCIKFRSLKSIQIDALYAAIKFGIEATDMQNKF